MDERERADAMLGSMGKDIVTGFTGIIVVYSICLFGNAQVWLQPAELEDGKCRKPERFDIDRIEVLGEGVTQKSEYTDQPEGMEPFYILI